jgi:hypothetical protein
VEYRGTYTPVALAVAMDVVRPADIECHLKWRTSIFFAYNAYSFFASQGLISMLIYNFSFACRASCRALKAIIDWTIMWAGECDQGSGVVLPSFEREGVVDGSDGEIYRYV